MAWPINKLLGAFRRWALGDVPTPDRKTMSVGDGLLLRDDAANDQAILSLDRNVTLPATGAPTITQRAVAGTGTADGENLVIQAQAGQQQTGGAANNDGGDAIVKGGAAGTGGGGAAGAPGDAGIQSGILLLKVSNALPGLALLDPSNPSTPFLVIDLNASSISLDGCPVIIIPTTAVPGAGLGSGKGQFVFDGANLKFVLPGGTVKTLTWT